MEALRQRIDASCASGEFSQRPVLQCASSSVLHGWGAASGEGLVVGSGHVLEKTGGLRAVGGVKPLQGDDLSAAQETLKALVCRLESKVHAFEAERAEIEMLASAAEERAAAVAAASALEQQGREAAERELLSAREQLRSAQEAHGARVAESGDCRA